MAPASALLLRLRLPLPEPVPCSWAWLQEVGWGAQTEVSGGREVKSLETTALGFVTPEDVTPEAPELSVVFGTHSPHSLHKRDLH